MPDRRGILTGGTWCVDRNRMVEFWPDEDAVAEILSDDRQGGGSACNLGIDIRRLDPEFPVETIGVVGNDEDGRFLLHLAQSHGIDTGHMVVTAEAATHSTEAYTSRQSGRRTHVYYAGASAVLAPAHFDLGWSRARILHLGLPGIHERMDRPNGEDANGWVTVLRRARQAGFATNLELASVSAERLAPLVMPCLAHLDLLVVNDTEIGVLAGARTVDHAVTDVSACVDAARLVLGRGAMALVAVHFPRGAVAVTRAGEVIIQASVAVPPSEVVGANGAGDAFAAGFLYGHHEGWPLEDCLRLAHASAATSLRGISTTGAMEHWRSCLDRAQRWGFREELPALLHGG